MADGNYWLSHDAQDIDDTIDEVQAARGSEASLSARIADIVSDFETDQQRQDTEIDTKITLAEAYGLGTVIPQNSDLNEYTSIGSYYVQSSSIAASLSNCPAIYTFRMEVKTTNSESRYMQTIYEVAPSGSSAGRITIYRRCYTASGWGSWYKFEGTQVAAAQSSAASLMQAGRLDAELTGAEEEER